MAAKKPGISWGDDAIKSIMKMLNRGQAKGKIHKTIKVGSIAAKQLGKQGKKLESKAVKTKVKLIEDMSKADAISARKASQAKVLKEQEKTLRATRLGEAAASKGSKLKGGKEVPMSRKGAEAAKRQGAVAGAQRARGNANKKAIQDSLRKQISDTRDAAKKRQLRQKLRNHEDKYGKFS